MLDFGFYNMDCMDGMKEFPDKYFDLAIVDPPIFFRARKKKLLWKNNKPNRSTETLQTFCRMESTWKRVF